MEIRMKIERYLSSSLLTSSIVSNFLEFRSATDNICAIAKLNSTKLSWVIASATEAAAEVNNDFKLKQLVNSLCSLCKAIKLKILLEFAVR